VRQGGFLVGFSQKIRSLVDQEHSCYSIGIPRGLAKMEYQRDEHRVHLIVYHLIWTPKRRNPVLKGKVAQECRRLIESKCSEKGGVQQNILTSESRMR
jgi:hypothetical protein